MADPAAIVGQGPALVLAPHPDDESLGCGSLLAACWRQGIPIHVAFLTDGAASHRRSRLWPRRRLAFVRRKEATRAIRALGGDPGRDATFLDFPDAGLHLVAAGLLERAIDGLVDGSEIRTLIAPSPFDAHCDHKAAFDVAEAQLRKRPGMRLITYPIWSRWLAQDINVPGPRGAVRRRFDDSESRTRKHRAILAHESQCGRVVLDDPTGFVLPPGFVEMFVNNAEIFDMRREQIVAH